MSRENVERIERFLALYNRREIDAWVGMMAPDMEWHVDPEALIRPFIVGRKLRSGTP